MDAEKKADLIAAANLLIKHPGAHAMYSTMKDTSALIARHKDLRLVGEAAPLNALALIRHSHPDTYTAVIDLIERKRHESGFYQLEADVEAKFDKSAYMQAFMLQKRERERRAVEIENMQRPERDKLIGRARLDFMQRQSAAWKDERDALLQRAKHAAAPKALKREELDTIRDAFWARVDARLDAAEEAARRGGPAIRPSASLADLDAALRHDPYA